MKINPNLLYEVLFEDDNGKDNNIQLSKSSANYSYIEIFYKDTAIDTFNSVKVYNPNGKRVDMACVFNGSGGTNTQFKNAVYLISGTSITLTNWYGNGQINASAASTATKTLQITIIRVLGYK